MCFQSVPLIFLSSVYLMAAVAPVFPKNLHAEVSLSKILNPKLCLIEQSAANRCTV